MKVRTVNVHYLLYKHVHVHACTLYVHEYACTVDILCCVIGYCSPGSHKMKGSVPSIFLVAATALSILLTLAKYISCTPRVN